MLGHGFRTTKNPPVFAGHSLPSRSTTATSTPKNGRVQLPGFVGVIPGSGVTMIAPVSVCHHVSTIGQRPPPITSLYHSHAFGLIGSPTDPRRRSEERAGLSGHFAPHVMHARIAVGAQ